MWEDTRTLPNDFNKQADELVVKILQDVIWLNHNSQYSLSCDFSGHVHGLHVRLAKGKGDGQYNEWLAEGTVYSLSDTKSYDSASYGLLGLQYMVQNIGAIRDGYDILPLLPRCVYGGYDHADLTKPPKEVIEDE
jgi:hypothetical protein